MMRRLRGWAGRAGKVDRAGRAGRADRVGRAGKAGKVGRATRCGQYWKILSIHPPSSIMHRFRRFL